MKEVWKERIRTVKDFPKPGIFFKDVTPLIQDREIFPVMMKEWASELTSFRGLTKLVGIEARGFIFGAAMAQELGVGFVPLRKPGKLPWKTLTETYALEYGQDQIQMHEDALTPSDSVLIVDDVLATGGTAAAAMRLVEQSQARLLGFSFLIELDFLKGREKLGSHAVQSFYSF